MQVNRVNQQTNFTGSYIKTGEEWRHIGYCFDKLSKQVVRRVYDEAREMNFNAKNECQKFRERVKNLRTRPSH